MEKLVFFIFPILISAVVTLDDAAFEKIFLEAGKQHERAAAEQFADGFQTRITPGHGRRANTKEYYLLLLYL
jgi:hypothetical protein